ncbi:MAG: diguanylate cyclase [Acidobacteriota bacterium]|nr:diguanylate cyclase [Acidobacteriota bacterium]
MADELVSGATSTAFADALRALAPAIQADAERYRPDDQADAAGWRLAMGACAKLQAAIAGGSAPGELDARMGELIAISPSRVPVAMLFEAAGVVERAILDELAPDPDLGATSSAWPFVAQRVRRASFDLLALFTSAINASPELLYDQTTTLLARRLLDIVLPQEIARSERHGRPLALLVISIDRLNQLEESIGMGTSERVLERVGILTRRYFRVHDWLTRFDAHAVCAVLPDTEPDTAAMLAERFRQSVRQRLVLEDHRDGRRVPVTLTIAVIGTSVMPAGVGPDELLREASQGIQRGRLAGGDRTERGSIQAMEISIPKAAVALGTGTLTVRRMIREGRLSSTRRGRHTYVSQAAIERLRERRQ